LDRERQALRQLINASQSHTPLPELIERLNRHLRGWGNYYRLGYPRAAFRQINSFVQYRPWAGTCNGVSLPAHLNHLGLGPL
jgi:hypothetical protein